MAKRGPKTAPTALKILKGNPHKGPLNDAEPVPDSTVPCVPEWLDVEGRACWERSVVQFERMGIWGSIDKDSFATYCDVWSRWRKAIDDLRENGDTYTTAHGFLAARPAVRLANDLMNAMIKYQREFGMTPSARSAIRVPASKASDTGIASKPKVRMAE